MPIMENRLVIDKGKRLGVRHVNGRLQKDHAFMVKRGLTKLKSSEFFMG
jgi:hypothetical protein